MNKEVEKILKVVEELNDILYNADKEREDCFNASISTWGNQICFNDIILWRGYEDEREWIEEKSDYEDLKGYIIKELKKYTNNLQTTINLLEE